MGGELLPMLQTHEVHIFASAFAADEYQQWFDCIAVTGTDGKPLLHVRIKKDIGRRQNRTESIRKPFETLDIVLGGAAAPLVTMPTTENPLEWQGIMMVFRSLKGRWAPLRNLKIGGVYRECVEVACPFSVHFSI